MAVQTLINRVAQQGNGSSAVFQYPYYFFATSDLKVYTYRLNTGSSVLQALGSNYTVSGTPTADGVYRNGGAVNFNSTPSADDIIIIFNGAPFDNDFTQSQFGTISSKSVTQQFDYVTLLAQQLKDKVDRAVKLPDGAFQSSFVTDMPMNITHASSAGRVLIVNSSLTGFEMGPSAAAIAGASQSAADAAAASAAAAAAQASAASAQSSAVSASDSASISALNAQSSAQSVANAVSLIGSTAFWGAQAQSSALSASNQTVLANSAAVSAGNLVVLANSAAVSAGNLVVLANSAAVSAGAQAVIAGSAALSASNSAALLNNSVVTKTANYTATINDRNILLASSAFTVFLPNNLGTGTKLSFQRTSPTNTNSVFIAGSACLVGNSSALTMDIAREALDLVFDGTNFVVLHRFVPTIAASAKNTGGGSAVNVYSFDTIIYDTQSSISGSPGTLFTAPKTGKYQYTLNQQVDTAMGVLLLVNSSTNVHNMQDSVANVHNCGAATVQLNKGDNLRVKGNSAGTYVATQTYMQCVWLGD